MYFSPDFTQLILAGDLNTQEIVQRNDRGEISDVLPQNCFPYEKSMVRIPMTPEELQFLESDPLLPASVLTLPYYKYLVPGRRKEFIKMANVTYFIRSRPFV